MDGWFGRGLKVDLGSGKIEQFPLDEEMLHKFIGGRGLGARLTFDLIEPKIDPLSPENVLIFSAGPLTATPVVTSSRFNLSTKSPLTGTITNSTAGGRWGARFKQCGFDALIIAGKAERPVYLSIKDEICQIKDARALWGKEVPQTVAEVLEAEGRGSVLAIGPAGECQVRMASIQVDETRALGRGGVGAVMGSKNLKAIFVHGTKTVRVADEEQLKFVLYQTNRWLKASPITSKGLPEFGTPVMVNIINKAGIFPTRNFQASCVDWAHLISGETIREKLFKGRRGCWRCPIACGRKTATKRMSGKGPEFEGLWALGPNLNIKNLETITEANYLCNRFGLDLISTGGTIACAMELSEKGFAKLGLKFGDEAVLLDLLRKIAYREGIGDELAEGSLRLAKKYGHQEISMSVKGLELPAYDPRGAQGMGLAYATSNRGGCHLRGGYLIAQEVLGVPKMVDRFSTDGKAGLVIVTQNLSAAVDSLVMCLFTNFAISGDYYGRLLSAVTGSHYAPQELQEIGERIWNLERTFNLRAGFTSADDTLPPRLLNDPIPSGPSQGHTVNLNKMLPEYYRFRGWDEEGRPGEERN